MAELPLHPCPSCASADLLQVEDVSIPSQHLAYAGGNAAAASQLDRAGPRALRRYRMLRCVSCRLEFADPAQAPSVEWYSALYGLLNLYPQSRWEYRVVADQMSADDVVVDFGCGSGHFLGSVASRVRRTHGFDFSADGIAQAQRNGINAHLVALDGASSAPSLPERAHHVVAFHVLEHMADPQTVFQFAADVAHNSARLWIAVPSDRRASRVYREVDALDAPPHHLTRWTELALRALGARSGWTLTRHEYEPLATHLSVWEATRRLSLYRRFNPANRSLSWLYRRALAAGVWLGRRHRVADPSGFSMLSCFQRTETT